MSIRRKAKSLEDRDDDQNNMVEAARLLVGGKSQQEIANEMSLSPSTISRLLNRAQSEGIIQVRLLLPPRLGYQEGLEGLLQPKGVRDVVVVAGGAGKNTANLGEEGARRVLRAINTVSATKRDDEPIRIALSCGTTVTSVIEALIKLLIEKEQSSSPLTHKLEIYPSTLYGDSELKPVYPHTIVAYFAMVARNKHLRAKYLSDHCYLISGHAIQLPKEFYQKSISDETRNDYKVQWKIVEFENKIKESDIFLIGAGTVADKSYEQIISQLDIRDDVDQMLKEAPGNDLVQVLYTPLYKNGLHNEAVSKKIVGVTISGIREICRSPQKQVILVAGGTDKIGALQTIIKSPCYTTLVTDSSTAREALLRHKSASLDLVT